MRAMRFGIVFAVTMLVASSISQVVIAGQVYLSLGDSIAFGEGDFSQDPSFGDRGYVSLYADYLGVYAGGVRPQVINLAIDGETSTSFSTGVGRVPPVPGITDAFLASLNLNYDDPNHPVTSQQELLLSTLTSVHAAGDTINNITISLGADDLFALVLSPAFNAPGANQGLLLVDALTTFGQNLGGLVGLLKLQAPEANIILLGTYNPFPAVPSSPFNLFAVPAIAGLNQTIQGVAAAFPNVSYADIYTPFLGHEAIYTRITDPLSGDQNVHPTPLGYFVIAAQLQAVPEPSTLLTAAIGVGGIALGSRRLRKRAAG